MLLIIEFVDGQLKIFVGWRMARVYLIPIEFAAEVHGHCFVDELKFICWEGAIGFSVENGDWYNNETATHTEKISIQKV